MNTACRLSCKICTLSEETDVAPIRWNFETFLVSRQACGRRCADRLLNRVIQCAHALAGPLFSSGLSASIHAGFVLGAQGELHKRWPTGTDLTAAEQVKKIEELLIGQDVT